MTPVSPVSPVSRVLGSLRGGLSPRAAEPRALALSVGAASVTAVSCRRSGGRLAIERAAVVPVPRAADGAAGAEAGIDRGIAGALASQGFSPASAVVALPREGALVSFATLPADDEAEFRAMARLALARELLSDGLEALGDFQIVRRDGGRAEIVLAAVPRSLVDAATSALDGMAARASLRALGALALVRDGSAKGAGAATLIVDLSEDAVEFTLVEAGVLRHSRSADLDGAATDRLDEVSAAFRRCLAAIRMAEGMPAPAEILLLASRDEASTLVPALAAIAGCPARRLESHPRIEVPQGAAREALLGRGWPLAGLLLDDLDAVRRDGSALDLLHPTPGIDVAARSRQAALVVAGLALVGALAGWTIGARSWSGLEERRDDLAEKARGALPELRRYKRDELRARHLDAHLALVPDWLAHLDALRRFAPDPSAVVLDGVTGQLSSAEVEYTAKGEFVARPEIRFVLDGEARDRETADALRDALVRTKGYTLGSTGADSRGGRRLPNPFAYTLRTPDLAPPVEGTSGASPSTSRGSSPAGPAGGAS